MSIEESNHKDQQDVSFLEDSSAEPALALEARSRLDDHWSDAAPPAEIPGP